MKDSYIKDTAPAFADSEADLEELRERQSRKRMFGRIRCDAKFLKNYMFLFMACYYTAMTVLSEGILHVSAYETQAQLQEALAGNSSMMVLASLTSVLQLLGGLAVPVAAFLLVEGFVNTHDLRGYLIRLLVLAGISEVPYDLAMKQKAIGLSAQNPVFALVVGLILLYGLRLVKGKRGFRFILIGCLMTFAAVLWTILLRADFGLVLVLLTAVYYLWREEYGKKVLIGAVISMTYVSAPISAYPLYCYNGERNISHPYVYYALYPLLLGACALVMHVMG